MYVDLLSFWILSALSASDVTSITILSTSKSYISAIPLRACYIPDFMAHTDYDWPRALRLMYNWLYLPLTERLTSRVACLSLSLPKAWVRAIIFRSLTFLGTFRQIQCNCLSIHFCRPRFKASISSLFLFSLALSSDTVLCIAVALGPFQRLALFTYASGEPLMPVACLDEAFASSRPCSKDTGTEDLFPIQSVPSCRSLR